MSERYDVVVAGGAVMGSAVAYFLAADPSFQGRIAVVERDPTYAACSTTRSWGGVRQQFSTPENIRMSLFAAHFLREAPDLLAVDGARPDFGFRENGYLFLASESGRTVLERNTALQRSLGAEIELLEPDELAARFSWLNCADLAAGAFGARNEGWIDPSSLLHAFRQKARSLGATYFTDTVTAVARSGVRIDSVTLASGTTLACGTLVNAAGPRAGRLAALCDVVLPVEPRKRMTYVFDCRANLPPLPLTIDPSGVATRPEGAHYLGIVSPPDSDDGPCDDLELDYRFFEEIIWPTLAARIPAFEAIKLINAWAGHYDYNSFDHNAVIGRHPEVSNLVFCNGFSGHGIQQSPAAGRAVAELILHGGFRSLDLSALGYERLAENRPLFEANVV